MAGIVWLASYPKSGNTWVRVLVQNYQDPARPAEINALTVRNAAQHALFDQFGAVEVSELTDDEVRASRPALYRSMAGLAPEPLFLKVHDAFGATTDGAPLFPADVTRAVIYIVRHPGDVAVSLAHHEGTSVAAAVSLLGRDDRVLGRRTGECVQHVHSWSRHVTSWVDGSGLRPHVVRYEDLLSDPVQGFSGILTAAGVAVDGGRLQRAIEHSRFECLQAQERAAGFLEQSPKATAPFFRNGRSGDWRGHLAPDEVRRLVEAHGEVMRRFGYLASSER